MPKQNTDKLKSYVETARALDREARALLVEVVREEETLASVQGRNDEALAKKFSMDKGVN